MTDKIILGTVQFGLDYGINNSSGKPGKEEVFSILELAFKNKICLLDTAEAYGNSHEVIGNYHRQVSYKFDIITKFSSTRTDLSADLAIRISQNLQVLNVNYLYAYMFHSFNDFETYYGEHQHSIAELKSKGVIKKFGVSIYTNEEFERLLKYNGVDLIQLPFNLLDNNYQRSALIAEAKGKGIEIHTRSVFLQGLFFKNPRSLPEKLAVLEPYLEEIVAIATENNLNIKDVALNYAVRQKDIDYVLIGVDKVQQLQDNLKSLGNKIPEHIIKKIDGLCVTETALLNPSNWSK
jgi:aryl-alcohol dehydrogenase-like predicted oxidoreductase